MQAKPKTVRRLISRKAEKQMRQDARQTHKRLPLVKTEKLRPSVKKVIDGLDKKIPNPVWPNETQ